MEKHCDKRHILNHLKSMSSVLLERFTGMMPKEWSRSAKRKMKQNGCVESDDVSNTISSKINCLNQLS